MGLPALLGIWMQSESDESEEAERPEASAIPPSLELLLQDWQQGDVFFPDDLPFFHLASVAEPLTLEAKEAAAPDASEDWLLFVPVKVPGLVIVTQTCDIVRAPEDRPYLEVAPLRALTTDVMNEVRRGERPQFAALPGLGATDLAADLDRVMTIEKSVLLAIDPHQKVRGCPTDEAAANFGLALARKRSRFAFPDDFSASLARIQKRIRQKHAKGSSEGQLYEACREIRARARPNWTNPSSVELWFLFDAEARIPGDADDILEALAERFTPTGVFKEIALVAAALDAISAKLYLESYPLDLDHLSGQR